MEANIQVISLTTTTSSPESASSTSHLLNTSSSSLISASSNYSTSGVLSQDSNSASNFASALVEDRSADEPKLKKSKCSEKSSKVSATESKSFDIQTNQEEKLEDRLWNVLCCAVCLELPLSAIYQCSQGHLICVQCFNHLLADARLKEEQATCASCRCMISKDSCTRNLAVEKACREMPSNCQHCNRRVARFQLNSHENDECEERPVICTYSKIGCPWLGPYHEKVNHERECSHPNKSGREVLEAVELIEKQNIEEKRLLNSIVNFLSYDRFAFTDLQLKPFRTDEYIQRLFYETSRFTMFNHHWVIKGRINDDQRDPTQSIERKLTYQLVIKSKTTTPITMHYMILKGSYGEMKVKPKIYQYEFSENNCEAPYVLLPLEGSAECNRLLGGKSINFRLIMFQMPK